MLGSSSVWFLGVARPILPPPCNACIQLAPVPLSHLCHSHSVTVTEEQTQQLYVCDNRNGWLNAWGLCYTEKAPNAWQRRGTQKTRNTYNHLHGVCVGACWGFNISPQTFLHRVASPFHSFVTTDPATPRNQLREQAVDRCKERCGGRVIKPNHGKPFHLQLCTDLEPVNNLSSTPDKSTLSHNGTNVVAWMRRGYKRGVTARMRNS